MTYSKWNTVIKELYDEVVKQMKENERKMKFEYKFYEKNQCPKWLEGDYDLHIEGNKMTMTSKDGIKVETRCHPEDDWRLQIGLDELKDRMNEKKKSREIRVGDKVRPTSTRKYVLNDCLNFFKSSNVNTDDVIVFCLSDKGYSPDPDFTYDVKYVGKLNDLGVVFEVAYIYNPNTNRAFVVRTSGLNLVKT